jgi:serine/threonine protein kinase
VEEALQTGRILGGRYRLGERLGQGGWGSVYAAVQMDLGRPVAIKVLHTSVALSSDGLVRFEREAKAAAALGHPNIAQVSDFAANLGEPPFLVMELLTGATLGATMRQSTKLAPARMAWIAYQILAGLDVAHNAGIVHRDIKPDNVFLVAMPGVEDFVKLLDFGIAKLSGESNQHLTTTGTMLGSPAFMAPEQVRSNDVDHRVDLYAVGATMYLALSGRMPFEAATVHGLLLAITEQRCVPLHVLDPSIDPALSAVVERAMHKDPNGRFATAGEMRGALEPWLGGMAAHASATANAPRPLVTAPMAAAARLSGSAPPPTPQYGSSGYGNQTYGAPPNGQYPAVSPSNPPYGGPALAQSQVGTPPNQAITNPAVAMTPALTGMPGNASAKGGGAVVALLAAVVVLLLVLVGGAGFYFYSRGAAASAIAVGTTATAPAPGASGATGAPAGAAPAPSVAVNGAPGSPGAAGAAGAGAKPKPGAGGGAGAPGAPATPVAPAIVADASAPAGGAKKQFAGTNFRIGGGTFESFDIDASKAAIMAKGGAIGACYAATEFDPPDHQFTDWTFQVDAGGNVKSVGRTTSFEPHPKFDACMVGALRQVKWPASKAGGSPHVNFTARTRDNP